MNTLYLITGPAGVGKSTVSKIIAESKKKSAFIEGDVIYNFVSGGYISPWKKDNHLEIFWNNSFDIINNFLENKFDVVFNYIIYKKDLELIKNRFSSYNIKFIVLMVDEETIIKRDKMRPLDWQMGERSLVLLNEFKLQNYNESNILDTKDLSIEETVYEIENSERFNII